MTYRSMRDCIEDLDRAGMLVRIRGEVDPNLEMAEIQRRVYAAGGKAVFFEKVKGSPFPAVCNLFGSMERGHFMFRKTWARTQAAIRIKADPMGALKSFWKYWHAPFTGLLSLPMKTRRAPVLECETTLDQLPQIKSWPMDGGAFITLPQVFTEDPLRPGVMSSNLGMYRVQISGNQYEPNRELGLHYQIHRGIGVHHTKAIEAGKPLKVAIFVGGPPAHTVAAVMPLPEGLSELVFAGMLAGRRFRYSRYKDWTVSADADFCILGTVYGKETKPEGPFGDHIGYYSLQHDFPVMKVEKVFHRKDAVWPFTVVGRPPQEDTTFGAMIHELTKPMVPVSLPGVKAMHAVDAAGVHPLLLAIGSERYAPFLDAGPQEILTEANAILGFNQASLAKYLWIIDSADDPKLEIHDVKKFMTHVLERVDWTRDLHFQTKTTMDSLDYSGSGLNAGSKVVIAARGRARRKLRASVSDLEVALPSGFSNLRMIFPGAAVVQGPKFVSYMSAAADMEPWSKGDFKLQEGISLLVVVDDSQFSSQSFENWLWVTFTRSQPSHDIYGVESFIEFKHWGCHGALIIDARLKPHHAPPLVEDAEVTKRVDANWSTWFAKDSSP